MCDCDIHSNIHCTWLKHFSELLDVFNCVNCIKTNLRKSNNSVKHCDLYCENCDPNNKNLEDSDECSWDRYFIKLLDEIKCVNCIKVNLQKANEERIRDYFKSREYDYCMYHKVRY